MTPHLTPQGKWLFVTGTVLTFAGAVVRLPVLVALGQVPIALLVVAVARILPAARALDRRDGALVAVDGGRSVRTIERGRPVELGIDIENRSSTRLHLRRLEPYVGGAVDAQVLDDRMVVGPREVRRFDVTVRSRRLGRSSLQGFDVELVDPWRMVTTRDYLPCLQIFETPPPTRPATGAEPRRRSRARDRPDRTIEHSSRSGTDMRELRDYQPGDPARTIAWKATVRQRRLISREFDDERTSVECVALDVSSSMRAGTPRGPKFDHALEVAARLCFAHLREGRRVGLWTFDHDVYGEIDVGRGDDQRRRIRRHLVGLNSVVEPGRTALDDEDIEEALADYLLVQQRLDFRRGDGMDGVVDSQLLGRWVESVLERERDRWMGTSPAEGVATNSASPVRELFRLRGLPLDPPSETAAGAKTRGIRAVFEKVLGERIGQGRLTVVTDLCETSDVELLRRPLQMIRRQGLDVRFLVPFTPHYGGSSAGSRGELIRDRKSVV